jgi:hypothetical protein
MSRSLLSRFSTRIWRMCTRFPVRDISWQTNVFFFVGAICFAISGFFPILTTVQPDTDFAFDSTSAIPVTSCLGDFFFFLGCTTAVLEALNAGRGAIDGEDTNLSELQDQMEAQHRKEHQKGGPAPWPLETAVPTRQSEDGSSTPATKTPVVALMGSPGFIWMPSSRDLRNYYRRDIPFLAAVISWTGIIFFTIATIAYIPGVANLNSTPVYYYLGLLPTFLGGFFFMVAALMQMTLVQRKWYLPALNRLSWYVGFWNSVGSLGFALGGCLWYAGESGSWPATLASFWGACGWLIGSAIGWYIVMDNY